MNLLLTDKRVRRKRRQQRHKLNLTHQLAHFLLHPLNSMMNHKISLKSTIKFEVSLTPKILDAKRSSLIPMSIIIYNSFFLDIAKAKCVIREMDLIITAAHPILIVITFRRFCFSPHQPTTITNPIMIS
jgi:hypothetical protein